MKLLEFYQWLITETRNPQIVSDLELRKHFNVFHLSEKLLDEPTFEFTPRVPRYPLDDNQGNAWEDDFTPRISLASSILDARNAGAHGSYCYAGYTDKAIPLAPRVDDCPGGALGLKGRITFSLGQYLSKIKDELTPEETKAILGHSDPPAKSLDKIRNVKLYHLPERIKNRFYLCVPDSPSTNEVVVLEPIVLMYLGRVHSDTEVLMTNEAFRYISST
jgi:hypothetical protein